MCYADEAYQPNGICLTLIHKFDFSSWRVFLATLGSIVLSLVLSIYAYNQHIENSRLRVNDLKYRYIKMVGDINDALVYDLEKLLLKDKNGKILDEMERQVKDYERVIEQKVRAEEQARLKRAESAELDKQTRKMKRK